MIRQIGAHGGLNALIDRGYLNRDNQTLTLAENPNFLTHLLILALIPSFSHFFTVPDNTSSSERDGSPVGAHG
jgi:hypothetical protein